MSKYKDRPPVSVSINFPFTLFLQLFLTSYSTMLQPLLITFCNNTIIAVFCCFCTEKHCLRSKHRWPRWPRAILPVQIKKTIFIRNRKNISVSYDYEKTVISAFTIKELKIRKSDVTLEWIHFVMASLCNGFTLPGQGVIAMLQLLVSFEKAVWKCFVSKDVYFCFCFFCLSMFTNKAILSWGRALSENICPLSETS